MEWTIQWTVGNELIISYFRVTSGISNPEQFSFISSSGKYLSLNNSLSMKNVSHRRIQLDMQKPDSDLTLLHTPDAKSDATWLLNLP